MMKWEKFDEKYYYSKSLGAELLEDGSADIRLWAPSADSVKIILYSNKDHEKKIATISMGMGNNGVWEVNLNKNNVNINNLEGYFYHYEIARGEDIKLALDPYAKSMAIWNGFDEKNYIGKACIVNPSKIGKELDFGQIKNFKKKEDAIIYEIHIRDFTSSPYLDGKLNSQFGTFKSFIEKLDYIEDLGVTHIQLLPVMSYYFANEYDNNTKILDFQRERINYNWGYDPHNYFSLTGMYSEEPHNPLKRIEEFKELISEIHKRGMGVILDVVYNHTAKLHIFEDLEPNYYHFMDKFEKPKESFGGGRLGTTHLMSRRILVDSILYFTNEFKIDGFRFDMMGDHDAESIDIAYKKASQINPNMIFLGEGWRTFAGDDLQPNVKPADQDWMSETENVGSFSDDFRDNLKSGFGNEGKLAFLTGGKKDIFNIYNNIKANPTNFSPKVPSNVVQYIEAHDNLTLHDVISFSIKKDPKYHETEIQERIRLGNTILLTSQGMIFIHAGQEYGRTKQLKHENFKYPVYGKFAPNKSTYMEDELGEPFDYPYFIHDSYNSSDTINMFDWEKVNNKKKYPESNITIEFTKGLIKLRNSTDAFSYKSFEEINKAVELLDIKEIDNNDLAIAYKTMSLETLDEYYIFLNADFKRRKFNLNYDLTKGFVLVDKYNAGIDALDNPRGISIDRTSISIDPLTACVVKVEKLIKLK